MALSSEDKLIVWPPCVMVENTGLGYDRETKKSIGLVAAEVKSAVRALAPNISIRRAVAVYNHAGHQGRYLILFPDSDAGYMDAVALHDAFRHRMRGREQWLANCKEGQQHPERNGGETKQELFGYLVDPEEMARIDRKKSFVKDWKVVSLQEKVIQFQREKMKASEENEKVEAELEASVEEQRRKLAETEANMDKLKAEIMSMDEEYAAMVLQQEEERRKHEEKKRRMIDEFEREKVKRLKDFHEKEKTMRDEIDKTLKDVEEEVARIRRDNTLLETDLRVKQALAISNRKTAAASESQMMLDAIKKRHLEALSEAKKRHLEEKKKLREDYTSKKQTVEQQYCVNQDALEKQIDTVSRNECQICMEEFGQERPKVFYIACKHAKTCQPCADAMWQRNHECPHCRTIQAKKPIRMYN